MDDVTAALAALSTKLKNIEKELERVRAKSTSALTLIDFKAASAGVVASFDFQSIPTTYSKLILDLYARGDTAATSVAVNLTFNNDAGANYYAVRYNVRLTTGLTVSEQLAGANIIVGSVAAASSTALSFDGVRIEVPAYANTNAHKICLAEFSLNLADTTTNLARGSAEGRWKSTAAISRVTLTPSAGNFAQYSTARLYGVA